MTKKVPTRRGRTQQRNLTEKASPRNRTDRADKAKKLVDEKTLGETLGLSERTLQDWRVRGCGPPYYQFGRSIRYCLEEVYEWMRQYRHTSTWDQTRQL